MKKLLALIVSLFISYLTFAQQVGFNYKALITDNGNPLSNTNVNIRFTILNGGTTVYKEVHNGVTTDQHGIVSVTIGEGTPITGTFNHKTYRDYTLKMKVEINTGSGWQNFGMEDLKFVPYAAVAHHLTLTDRIVIGSNTSDDEKLFVKANPTTPELVEFYHQNPNSGDDVLQLTMDAPASGTAQFIEAKKGSNTVFILHDDGTIKIDGELQSNISGSADMKAYVYGYVFYDGTKITSRSSSGWTVQKTATGTYRVTLTGVSDGNFIAIVTSDWGNTARMIVSDVQADGSFIVDIYDKNGNHVDEDFQFVVFRP